MNIGKIAAVWIAAVLCTPGILSAAKTASADSGSSLIENKGYRPYDRTVYDRSDLTEKESGKNRKAANLPDSFDLRTEGMLSSVRDQKTTGSCWAFATIGSAESNLMKKGLAEDPDLSERQLAFFSYNRWLDPLNLTEGDILAVENSNSYDLGGNLVLAATALASWRGAVDEEKAPFSVIENGDVDEHAPEYRLPDRLMYQEDSWHMENMERIYLSTPERIKKALMEKGYAATIDVHAADTQQERDDYYSDKEEAWYVDDENLMPNHTVLLVGWDDNYPVSNFNRRHRPSKPGAWLFRNSWGTEVGEDGYCWISYEDKILNQVGAEVAFFDMAPADNYDCNYQYDNGASYVYLSNTAAMANVYRSQHSETLEAVSFWTEEREVGYEIKIYRQPEYAETPDSGVQLGDTIRGTVQERGYHTIDFSRQGKPDIPLEKGETFSVVIKLDGGDGEVSPVVAESNLFSEGEEERETVSLGEGESYYMDPDGRWNDMADMSDGSIGNLRIKAFTSIDDSVPCDGIEAETDSLELRAGQTAKIGYTLSPSDVTNDLVTWVSEDDGIARVSNGIVYGIKAGNTTVTGTINGFRISVAVTVSEVPIESLLLPQSLSLFCNQQIKPDLVLTPADTTDTITWETSDPSKVYVLPDGTILALEETGRKSVVVEASAGGQTARCRVTVSKKAPDQVTCEEMQSFHPYLSGQTQKFEYARENAVGYRITFSDDTNFEEDFDFLYFYDERGEVIAEYTGDALAGRTIEIDSSKIWMELVADVSSVRYGFRITDIVPIEASVTTPTGTPSATPTATPTETPSVTPTAAPTETPSVMPTAPSGSAPSEDKGGTLTGTSAAAPEPAVQGTGTGGGSAGTGSKTTVLVKKLKFSPKTKKVKAGKKLNLKKYLKVTKKKKGNVSFSWSFTKKKFSKWASLTQKGVCKTKKKGRGKTVRVRVKAKDGSGRSAVMTIRIR